MKKQIILSAIITLTIFIAGCRKEDNDSANDIPASGSTIVTTISGKVTDENNNAVFGVTVSAYGKNTTTDQFGLFILKNVNAAKSRCIVEFNRQGYFKRQHAIVATANTVNYIRIALVSNTANYTIMSGSGGTVNIGGGGSIVFQPNSFVTSGGIAYSGTVSIAVKHLSPGSVNFGFAIPGGDLLGVDAGSNDVALYSYGMMGVELTGSGGQPLQLASGTPATLKFQIATTQQATAPATIPLWYFDEATALWKEEGSATKTGNMYVGTVAHFSWWNCDVPAMMVLVTGKVVDCSGAPLANVLVTVIANNGYSTYVSTNQNGIYTYLVGANFSSTAQFQANLNPPFFQNSNLANAPALIAGGNFTMADLIVSCPTRIAGSLKKCNGESTDGLVMLKQNGTVISYNYTTSGSYILPALSSTQTEIYATNFSTKANQTVTSLIAPNILQAGNLMLCDTVNLDENSFTISSTIINDVINVQLTSSSGRVEDSLGNINTSITMMGSAFPTYTISQYNLNMQDTVAGTTFGDLYLVFTSSSNLYYVYSNTTPLICNITELGPIGGKIKGTFGGQIIISTNGASNIGTITGKFNITRTQ